jgi:hypothetical protein
MTVQDKDKMVCHITQKKEDRLGIKGMNNSIDNKDDGSYTLLANSYHVICCHEEDELACCCNFFYFFNTN